MRTGDKNSGIGILIFGVRIMTNRIKSEKVEATNASKNFSLLHINLAESESNPITESDLLVSVLEKGARLFCQPVIMSTCHFVNWLFGFVKL
jgi:hypothetical protein